MKTKPRWMKSVLATAKEETPSMPFMRTIRASDTINQPENTDHA